MRPSLTVLLPLRNAESRLISIVGELLEILPELTLRFDVLVIDDGSTDATAELAHEFAMLYPQVAFARHPRPLGRTASMRTGLNQSSGDYVLYRDLDCQIPADELTRLWSKVGQFDVVLGRAAQAAPLGSIPRSPDTARSEPGLQLIRRKALESWRLSTDPTGWLAHLLLHGASFCEVVVRPVRQRHADLAPAVQPARRPKFLERLRAFTLGE